nr:MAG TPA: hypothetical protein [Caudoviricetes sp.]
MLLSQSLQKYSKNLKNEQLFYKEIMSILCVKAHTRTFSSLNYI